MTKFKHRETGCQRMLARIPFGAIIFGVMMSFALMAAADAGEPVEAHDLIWDSELLTGFEEAQADASTTHEILMLILEDKVNDKETLLYIKELIGDLNEDIAYGVRLHATTKAANELADIACSPIEEESTDEYDNFNDTRTRFFSTSL